MSFKQSQWPLPEAFILMTIFLLNILLIRSGQMKMAVSFQSQGNGERNLNFQMSSRVLAVFGNILKEDSHRSGISTMQVYGQLGEHPKNTTQEFPNSCHYFEKHLQHNLFKLMARNLTAHSSSPLLFCMRRPSKAITFSHWLLQLLIQSKI